MRIAELINRITKPFAVAPKVTLDILSQSAVVRHQRTYAVQIPAEQMLSANLDSITPEEIGLYAHVQLVIKVMLS
jgi:hypothetical protein